MLNKIDYIYNYAIDLIIKKEYCSYTLYKQLIKKFNNKNEVNEVINKLKEKKYIDDYDYINSYIYKYINKYKGFNYISNKLLLIGFDEKYIKFNYVKYNELEENKLIEYINNNRDIEKDKLIRRLISKGYSNNLIYKHLFML